MGNPEKKPEPNVFNKWRLVNLGFELGFIIALPLLVFALSGKWLDDKLNTKPWLTLLGIFLAISGTTVWMTRRFREYIK